MQNGSVIRAERQRGPDVWEFRWREASADGKRKHRRMILGSIEQLAKGCCETPEFWKLVV